LGSDRFFVGLLISTFAMSGSIIMRLDDTIERCSGAKIKVKEMYRDPVRFTHGYVVKASGLHWLGLMLMAPIPSA
jgi:hypothetical protein